MPVFTAPKGIQLQLRSPSGEVLAYLSDNERVANKLNVSANETILGLDELTIEIPRDIDLPITRNSEITLYVDSVPRFIAIVQENPTLDQSNPIIKLKLRGLIHELERKIINVTYTTQTLDYIIKALCSSFLGADINIFYDVAKITTPSISNITIEFKDVSIYKAFETCMKIANYSTIYYRFYIDLEKEFVFAPFSSTIQDHLFEGYHFQNPEVSIETSKMVNRIRAYRTTLADPNVTEYVATYDNSASQSKYGLFEEKLIVPNYVDATTIEKIATFILNKRSLPLEKVSVDSVVPFKSFGKYRVSNKPNSFWKLISDCNLLTEWDLTHITDTVVTLSTARVLTGRQSLRIITTDGSGNEYIELTLLKEIAFPQVFRLFMYFVSTLDLIRITIYDTDGNNEILDLVVASDFLETSDGLLDTSDGLMTVDFITETVADTWLKLTKTISLKNIKKIRITFLTNEDLTFYIDRLDIYGRFYSMYELWLEEIEYELNSKLKNSSLYLGDPSESFANEIEEKIEEGDIAFSIFGKP